MTLFLLAVSFAAGLAFSIGANNAGVHMAPAFGAGARGKWASLVLFALFTLLGSVALGSPVVKTLGQGLFTQSLEANAWFFLVLAPGITVALISLANHFRLPVPTTPLAVCSLLGIGLYFGMVNGAKAVEILVWWVGSPLIALAVTWAAGKILVARFPALLRPEGFSPRARKTIGWLLTIEGCYSAFAIGSNNVANATGPLVGGGHMSVFAGTVVGGLAMAAGAVLWGGRVLETVGKGITELCYVRALVVGVVGATGLVAASVFGAPVSGALIVTCGVLGFSFATEGMSSTAENRNVRRILAFWGAGPAVALAVSYGALWAGRGSWVVHLSLAAAAVAAAGAAAFLWRRSRRPEPELPRLEPKLERYAGGC